MSRESNSWYMQMFRLAYVSPESRVVGAGDLVDHPKKIALNYLKGYFFIDLFVVLPLPQIMISFVLRKYLGISGANFAKNLLRATILLQYFPRLFRFLPLLIGQSPTGFIFESAWANFIINLLFFILSGHVVGSGWNLFGLQRVNQCLRKACQHSNITGCSTFIDCGSDRASDQSELWNKNVNATACLDSSSGAFPYGIYVHVVPLTIETRVVKKYVFALFWGFQGNVEHISISSDAKNLVTSDFEDQHEAAEGVLLDDDLNEPTMGEKLASLSVLDGNKSRSDIEQESCVLAKPPSADSVHVLLKQALNVDDRTLLLDCLFTQNEKQISNFVQHNNKLISGDYRTHVSEVERESSTTEFPNAYVSLNKKVVYEESENEGSHHHHLFHRHHHPETRESVKVVEYEQVPQRRVGEVVYEENSRTVWP
ncbi:putative cyclic nucleotide-gated ion channel 20, chloroplastic [Glycine soja]|uniref:Putative cyclic nucleotide-gated ion channel 20, chloroplastic n=1 Tax=Glycine soja TaxID=3848 RepID=A0A445L287_GLYSO|nr:putative cyclic nucleotide-gated ion channel 20, chloroplastic [Glycine soja]